MYHPDKFGDHSRCESGHMFLICHATSCDHMFRGLCYFMPKPLTVNQHLAMLVTIGRVRVEIKNTRDCTKPRD